MTDESQIYKAGLFGLEGRVAVVTGGSSGIGRAIAVALARAGARVVLVARDQDRLIDTADELDSLGCHAAWVTSDLSDRDNLRAAAEKAVEAFGEPDLLVNSAGVNLRSAADARWSPAAHYARPHQWAPPRKPGTSSLLDQPPCM